VPDLPPIIRALLRPSAYSHTVNDVKLVQTHISYVILVGEHVYKIKKPLNFGFLDYSTLGKRRHNCLREVTLNSRLCSDVYLGVEAIRDDGGRIAVGGRRGRVVEYAVHMRRLPEERMMHRLLERGEVSIEMVEHVADRVAAFHAVTETSPRIAEYGGWAIRYAWNENIRQWAPNIGRTINVGQDRILRAYGEAFFARSRDILQRRVRELRIRDNHSDLRCDAVCVREDGSVCIMDCVEFNRRIRLVDVARDVGFLAMDLDYRGRSDLAEAFVGAYVRASGDGELREIIDFYKCYNACVRGKVDGFRLSQPEVPAAERRATQRAARRHFELACHYAASLPPAMLVITCGLPGTGKSTLARALGQASGFEVLSSDVVRKEQAGISPKERRLEEYREGIYSPDATERTYEGLLEGARPLLLAGRSVVLDASFIRREHRRAAARTARKTGAQFACLELVLSDEAARRRLARRLRRGGDPSDARWGVYVAQKRRFQKPSEVGLDRRIVIDAARPIRVQTRTALASLRALSPISLTARRGRQRLTVRSNRVRPCRAP